MNGGLYSSATPEWPTPPDVFARLDREFRFVLDPCATPDNAKCARYFTREDDGLAQDWAPGPVFMNPPYGRVIADWVAKAHEEAKRGVVVVGLLPARTDTRWWHEHVTQASEVRFLRGRLKFGTATNSAPFPSAVVIWAGVTAIRHCEECGTPIRLTRRDARYCRPACRQRAYRRRTAA